MAEKNPKGRKKQGVVTKLNWYKRKWRRALLGGQFCHSILQHFPANTV